MIFFGNNKVYSEHLTVDISRQTSLIQDPNNKDTNEEDEYPNLTSELKVWNSLIVSEFLFKYFRIIHNMANSFKELFKLFDSEIMKKKSVRFK